MWGVVTALLLAGAGLSLRLPEEARRLAAL
jgi:hypothetical protein